MAAMRRLLDWQYRKLKRRAIQGVCRRLYRDRDRDTRKSILVAGTGRSGTTWVADIVKKMGQIYG